MSLFFPEIIDPDILLPRTKVPCVVPPPNPLKELREMITRHTGFTVGFLVIRNGYWEADTIFGQIRVSDLLKRKKCCSIN